MTALDRRACHSRLLTGLHSLGLSLSTQIIEKLLDYLDLLLVWNAKFNLTAVRDPLQMVTRHLLDSLSISPYVTGRTLIDIGSGAGLPGIPLALTEPARQVLLVDSNGKKVRFLCEAIQVLGLVNTQATWSRIEQIKQTFDCVTARAFSTLEEMLKLGGHLLAKDGVWLAQKGRYPDAELATLPRTFTVAATHKLHVPDLDAERHLVIIRRTNESMRSS